MISASVRKQSNAAAYYVKKIDIVVSTMPFVHAIVAMVPI